MSLKADEEMPEETRELLKKVAISIFTRHEPRDPPDVDESTAWCVRASAAAARLRSCDLLTIPRVAQDARPGRGQHPALRRLRKADLSDDAGRGPLSLLPQQGAGGGDHGGTSEALPPLSHVHRFSLNWVACAT